MKETMEITPQISTLADRITEAFKDGHMLFICGNGGSAAEADHMAAELVGKFETDNRPALPAMALSSNGAIITSLGNDRGYELVFARQVEAYGREGDVLLVITTSDYDLKERHTVNLLAALIEARKKKMVTAGIVSKERTHQLLEFLDFPVLAEGTHTAEIQENQIKAVHEICRIAERSFV